MAKVGRPSMYTPELAERICEAVATTPDMLEEICDKYDDFPCADTVYTWVRSRPQFAEMFARAKEYQIDTLVSHGFNIIRDTKNDLYNDGEKVAVNHATIARARMESDYIKWLASKLKRKKYGDSQEVTVKQESPFQANAEMLAGKDDKPTDK